MPIVLGFGHLTNTSMTAQSVGVWTSVVRRELRQRREASQRRRPSAHSSPLLPTSTAVTLGRLRPASRGSHPDKMFASRFPSTASQALHNSTAGENASETVSGNAS